MKQFFALMGLLVVLPGFSRSGKSILRQSYVVVSDVFSKDIPAGKCLVMGKVYKPEYDEQGQLPLSGVSLMTLDGTKSTRTDEQGVYKLMLDSKDTSFYMFSPQYEEIVIWNYLFRSQHMVTINFFPQQNNQMLEVDKPVIYLYSEKELDVEVQFASKAAVTFTYPAYLDSWKMRVTATGLNDVVTSKTYPYLFWEGETKDLDFKFTETGLEGVLIKTDTVVSFLESSLGAMGMNETEQTDFITFWAPRMIQEPYALVQFLTNDDYTNIVSSLTIKPAPDQLFRVFMLFSPLKSDRLPLSLTPQVFTPFERSGLTVVEWGGSALPSLQLIP